MSYSFRVLLIPLWGPGGTLHIMGAQPCYWLEVRAPGRAHKSDLGEGMPAPGPGKAIPLRLHGDAGHPLTWAQGRWA